MPIFFARLAWVSPFLMRCSMSSEMRAYSGSSLSYCFLTSGFERMSVLKAL